jgi:two-component system, NarL family, nitrate/nitrite response regulator NarL
MTQEALSERSGVSVDAISALENGRRCRPHSYTIRALADALGLSPGDQERLAAAGLRGIDDSVTELSAETQPAWPGRGGQGEVRVAIVDDHPIARYGMEHVLANTPGLRLVLSAPDAAELLVYLKDKAARPADVVVMDLYLQGDQPSTEALRQLARLCRVLVISASTRPADVISAILAGASGYMTKRALARTFAAAIEAVHSDGFWLSSELADVLRGELGAGTREPPDTCPGDSPLCTGLSPDEDEILGNIARGLSHEQTARRMGISTTEVDLHIHRIGVKIRNGDEDGLHQRRPERPEPQMDPHRRFPPSMAPTARQACLVRVTSQSSPPRPLRVREAIDRRAAVP